MIFLCLHFGRTCNMGRTYPRDIRKDGMTRSASIVAIVFALAGCASTKDVDLSKLEPQCGQKCAASYQECTNRPGFILFPIEVHNQCVGSLKLCASACPARNGSALPGSP
jgi:hypothetical protein